jgi:hypothetical protein
LEGGLKRIRVVGVGEDQRGVLAAHFERQTLERRRREPGDLGAGRGAARERHTRDIGMRDQGRADLGPGSMNDVENSGRQASFGAQRGEQIRRHGRVLGWFGHHAVARREGRRGLPDEEVQGQIPRRDTGDHSERLVEGAVAGPGFGNHAGLQRQAAVALADAIGVEPEHADAARDVHARAERQQLTRVDRFGPCELVASGFQFGGERAQHLGAESGRLFAPGRQGVRRDRHRLFHIRRS